MAGNAENLAIGQSVRTTLINRHDMMCLPTAVSIVIATGIPVKYLPAPGQTMSTVAPSTFTSSARRLRGQLHQKKPYFIILSPTEIDKAEL